MLSQIRVIFVNFIVLCIVVLSAELFARDVFDRKGLTRLSDSVDNLISGYFSNLYQFDEKLGWIPRPHSRGTMWDDKKVTTWDYGFRVHEKHSSKVLPESILAVGDSFTFGDEVSDEETWVNHLSNRMGAQILNAGVSSYGFGQIFLRMESLIDVVRPQQVLFSFIEEDVQRLRQKVRHSCFKPFFVLKNSTLTLQGVPVSRPLEIPEIRGRSWLAKSYFVNLMQHFFNPSWMKGSMDYFEETEENPLALFKLLLQRVNAIEREKEVEIKMIYFGSPGSRSIGEGEVYALLKELRPNFIDISTEFVSVAKGSEIKFKELWPGHFSVSGNEVVAEWIFNKLSDRKIKISNLDEI